MGEKAAHDMDQDNKESSPKGTSNGRRCKSKGSMEGANKEENQTENPKESTKTYNADEGDAIPPRKRKGYKGYE